jgi:hypothetical protein
MNLDPTCLCVYPNPDTPVPACMPYQPPLLSLMPPTLLPLSPSLCGTASVSAWRCSGLGVSRTRRGSPSSPQHGGAAAPAAPVTVDQRTGGSGSLS